MTQNTEQAEEVITVLFASRQLKRVNPEGEVSEQQLLDFIVGWKKSWAKDEKRQAVTNAIRNLALLGWLRVRLDESVDEAA